MDKLTLKELQKHIKDKQMPIKMSHGGKALKKEELVKVVKALSPEEKAVEKAAVAVEKQAVAVEKKAKAVEKKAKAVESGSVAKRSAKAKAHEKMESKPEAGVIIVEAQKPMKAKKETKPKAKKESAVKPMADISRKITLTL